MADTSGYPSSIDTGLQELVLAAAVTPAGAADFLALLGDAVVKMQAELGVNPSGDSSTVAARLEAGIPGGGGEGRAGVYTVSSVDGVFDLTERTEAHLVVADGETGVRNFKLPPRTTAGAFFVTIPGTYTDQPLSSVGWLDNNGDPATVDYFPGLPFTFGTALLVPTTEADPPTDRWLCFSLSIMASVIDMDFQRQTMMRADYDADADITLAETGLTLASIGADDRTFTVPPFTDGEPGTYFDNGAHLHLVQLGTGTCSVAAGAGVTINTPTGKSTTLAGRYAEAHLYRLPTLDEWVLAGELADV